MRSHRLFTAFLACLLQLSTFNFQLRAAPAAPAARIEEGEIAGAKFRLVVPADWNHRVLLLAHGYRAESAPLVADLFPEHLAYRTLVSEGWIVAKTSFRRNGLIVADAVADLDALREHIEQKFGAAERILLEGESMGGLIVTLLAEREATPYAGAVAIGAALDIREPNGAAGLSLQPRVPLIFLTNQSELAGPRGYVIAKVDRPSRELRPALLRVSRDGHVNVNQPERLTALRALNAWLDRGRATLPTPAEGAEFADVTAPPAPQPSRLALHADTRGFDAHVSEISGVYGNVQLDAQPADFAAIGLFSLQYFELKVNGQTYRVRYARDFADVKRGEWVAFPNADGFTWLARNYENAATTAALKLGDTVTLRRYDEPK